MHEKWTEIFKSRTLTHSLGTSDIEYIILYILLYYNIILYIFKNACILVVWCIILYHFILCSFHMCVVVLTNRHHRRAEQNVPNSMALLLFLLLNRWSFHPHLHCTRASRRDAHTHTRLGQGVAILYTRATSLYIPRQPDRYDDAEVDSSWSACFAGETPVRFLLLSRYL